MSVVVFFSSPSAWCAQEAMALEALGAAGEGGALEGGEHDIMVRACEVGANVASKHHLSLAELAADLAMAVRGRTGGSQAAELELSAWPKEARGAWLQVQQLVDRVCSESASGTPGSYNSTWAGPPKPDKSDAAVTALTARVKALCKAEQRDVLTARACGAPLGKRLASSLQQQPGVGAYVANNLGRKWEHAAEHLGYWISLEEMLMSGIAWTPTGVHAHLAALGALEQAVAPGKRARMYATGGPGELAVLAGLLSQLLTLDAGRWAAEDARRHPAGKPPVGSGTKHAAALASRAAACAKADAHAARRRLIAAAAALQFVARLLRPAAVASGGACTSCRRHTNHMWGLGQQCEQPVMAAVAEGKRAVEAAAPKLPAQPTEDEARGLQNSAATAAAAVESAFAACPQLRHLRPCLIAHQE
jgi:hypothetical protein